MNGEKEAAVISALLVGTWEERFCFQTTQKWTVALRVLLSWSAARSHTHRWEMNDLNIFWSVLARDDIIGIDNGGRLTRVYFSLPTKLSFLKKKDRVVCCYFNF